MAHRNGSEICLLDVKPCTDGVRLDTMLTIIVNIYRDAKLLPHFLDHYAEWGFSRVLIVVNEHGAPDLLPLVEGYCAAASGLEARVVTTYSEEHHTFRFRERLIEVVAEHVPPGAWYSTPDLDELITYPLPLPALIAASEAQGVTAVMGQFIDHIARDGSLPPIGTESLWSQFPLEADVTRLILKAKISKVIFQTGPLQLGMHGTQVPALSLVGRVHHFKWNADVLERLRERAVIHKKNGLSWWVESQRFLDHIAAHGRIDLKTLRRLERWSLVQQAWSVIPQTAKGSASAGRRVASTIVRSPARLARHWALRVLGRD
jgi:hypothetical protein